MSSRFPGGLDKPNIYPAVTGTGTTRWTGMWTLTDAANALVAGNWASSPIWGSGYNSNGGGLGLGDTTARSSLTAVGGGMIPWTDISSGARGCLALRQDGTLWAWGTNPYGALGDSTIIAKSSPIQVGALTTWAKIAMDTYTSFAIKSNGTLWSWGYNMVGQLGDSTVYSTNRSSPVQVGALTNWSAVFCGSSTIMAVKSDGTLWGWGRNTSGQLGIGNTTNYSSPKQVGALTTWSKVTIDSNRTLALKTDGTLWAWGSGSGGTLGDGTTVSKSSPIQIGALTTWTATGKMGAIKGGELWHWGYVASGRLAIGGSIATNYSSPVQVGVQTNWSSLSTGGGSTNFGTAIKTDGTLWGWGANQYGALGTDNTTTPAKIPTQISNLTTWIKTTNQGYASVHLKTV